MVRSLRASPYHANAIRRAGCAWEGRGSRRGWGRMRAGTGTKTEGAGRLGGRTQRGREGFAVRATRARARGVKRRITEQERNKDVELAMAKGREAAAFVAGTENAGRQAGCMLEKSERGCKLQWWWANK